MAYAPQIKMSPNVQDEGTPPLLLKRRILFSTLPLITFVSVVMSINMHTGCMFQLSHTTFITLKAKMGLSLQFKFDFACFSVMINA